jgi:cytochrome b involved in lipid metabolism
LWHNEQDDICAIVGGQVFDATKFPPDHSGVQKAISLYAGRDAFNMLHDPKVIS